MSENEFVIDLSVNEEPIKLEVAGGDVTVYEGSSYFYKAEAAIGGHKAVVVNENGKLIYADNLNMTHANKVLGITKNAADADGIVEVQVSGELTEPTWTWTPGLPIYLSTNGMLTQAAPTSGFVLNVAFAITATKIFIEKKQPIIL